MFLVTSVVPALLLFALSFAVERGKIWAGPALVLVCVAQIPGIVFCGGCFAVLPSAYLLARCLVAWPEITFQIRAARRNRAARGRGFEAVPAAATTTTPVVGAGGTSGPAPGRRPGATLLVPKSLKPSTRSPRPDLPDAANLHQELTPPSAAPERDPEA
jgi:hypothetical protein